MNFQRVGESFCWDCVIAYSQPAFTGQFQYKGTTTKMSNLLHIIQYWKLRQEPTFIYSRLEKAKGFSLNNGFVFAHTASNSSECL